MSEIKFIFTEPLDRSSGNFPMTPTIPMVIAENTGDTPMMVDIYDPRPSPPWVPRVMHELVIQPGERAPILGSSLYHIGIAAQPIPPKRKGLMRFSR